METEENPLLTRAEPGRDTRSPPVIAVSRNEDDQTQTFPDTVPILPLRNTVIFPGTVVPLTVGRPSSRRLLEESLSQSKVIGVFTQRNPEQDDPAAIDLHQVGAAALVLKLIRQSEEATLIVVQALRRVKITRVIQVQPFIRAQVEGLHSRPAPAGDTQWEATVGSLRESALRLIALAPEAPPEATTLLNNIEDPGTLADFLAGSMSLDVPQKQDLLEELDVVKRVRAIQVRVSAQLEIARLQQKIQKDVQSQFTDAQRRAYLREQLRAIQKELGEESPGSQLQIDQLKKRLNEAQPPKEVM
ncbi:MAG: LON peptidase substrate-binding domain-containing protein, partial [Limisphaerales bacterium]